MILNFEIIMEKNPIYFMNNILKELLVTVKKIKTHIYTVQNINKAKLSISQAYIMILNLEKKDQKQTFILICYTQNSLPELKKYI